MVWLCVSQKFVIAIGPAYSTKGIFLLLFFLFCFVFVFVFVFVLFFFLINEFSVYKSVFPNFIKYLPFTLWWKDATGNEVPCLGTQYTALDWFKQTCRSQKVHPSVRPLCIPPNICEPAYSCVCYCYFNRILYSTLSIFSPDNIHNSLFLSSSSKQPSSLSSSSTRPHHSCFSFTRFINMSPAELHSQMLMGLLARWLAVYLIMKSAYRVQHTQMWQQDVRLDVNNDSNKTRWVYFEISWGLLLA